jgi:hypothetical protein
MASPPFYLTISFAICIISTFTYSAGVELLKEKSGELVENSAAPEKTTSTPAESYFAYT